MSLERLNHVGESARTFSQRLKTRAHSNSTLFLCFNPFNTRINCNLKLSSSQSCLSHGRVVFLQPPLYSWLYLIKAAFTLGPNPSLIASPSLCWTVSTLYFLHYKLLYGFIITQLYGWRVHTQVWKNKLTSSKWTKSDVKWTWVCSKSACVKDLILQEMIFLLRIFVLFSSTFLNLDAFTWSKMP